LSAGTVAGTTGGRSLRRVVPRTEPWCLPDSRRVLQLSLAALWLFDAVLQLQPFMFTPGFGSEMIAPFARGNPASVASAITWSAGEMSRHATLAGVAFAGAQLLIAVGIAWRPTVRIALGLSVAWSLGVWWIGEGLGNLLTGTASPLTGAPGAVLLYALLAILLWPAPPGGHADFVAARPLGAIPARLIWLLLWSGLAVLSVSSFNRQPDGISGVIRSMTAGQPTWLAALDRSIAQDLAGRGGGVAIATAVLFGLIAVAVFMPRSIRRASLILACVAAVAIWVVGEGFGGVFSGPATDPNSGPLLILLAAAYWPLRPRRTDLSAASAVEMRG
jgi:hypothetical protein